MTDGNDAQVFIDQILELERRAFERGLAMATAGKTEPPLELMASRVDLAESLSWLDSLPEGCAGGVITDPPYSSGGAFRGDRITASGSNAKYISTEHQANYVADFAGDNRDQRAWLAWSELWLRKAYRVTCSGGVVACFVDWRQLPTLTDAIQAAGWVMRGIVPWNKTQATRPVRGRFRSQCEYIVWGSKGGLPIERDAPVLPGCLTFPVSRSKQHPTQKPVDMLRVASRIVERGQLILDPFAGSSAHGVAAILEGHVVPEYAEIGRAWIAETLETLRDSPMLFDPNEVQAEAVQGLLNTTPQSEEE